MNRVHHRRRYARLGIATITTALGVAALTLAAAPTAAHAATRPNCVADLTGRTPTTCFATMTEAVAAATGGRLTDAPATGAEALRDAGFPARVDTANAFRTTAANDIVISIEYDLRDHDEDGGILIWKGDKECTTRTTDVDYQISDYNVSAPNWVNRISSFQTFGNCWAKHFENPNLGGASVGFEGTRAYIGAAMDNRTSSQQWS